MEGRFAFVLVLLVKIIAAGRAPVQAPGGMERLAWMAGSWASDSAGVRIEEHWTDPSGGLMLGMHRDLRNGRATAFEFLRIEANGNTVQYLAQPSGRPATPFPARELGDHSVTFENRDHDYPQRISYWLDSDGALHARIEGRVGGKARSEEWRWARAHLSE